MGGKLLPFFSFKQKTAYEMSIGDWSSDVCSSDLWWQTTSMLCPVRTNDESCVVVRVVVRAQTRRTIVFATRLYSRAIESFDLLAILGRERQVKMRRLLLGLVQAQ